MSDSTDPKRCPTAEQLEAYLKAACPADQAAAIRDHLAACPRCREWVDDARANEVLLESVRVLLNKDRPAIAPTPGLDPDLQVIEGYEILAEVGRGGMGVVYKARQVGTKRTVALKVLLDGPLASESARRRFEREIELAASLSHPNIVPIHDSGLSRGHYYFAMDFIDGIRLDRYVKSRDLPVEQRLRLMQKICLAVNYAHQRGVIHRDLKPSNIIVDAAGEPHILDFGLAKTVESPQAESLLISLSGEVLGTLPYMAPEQALGIQRDVDCRTDVYTLGVIFYEMLTGQYPYPVAGQMAEVLKNIAEAEPARPSTIYRAIRSDLETILLKTLSKEKESRYDSAGALANDIGRYMAGEAIEAKRDSGWYVLRKTLRRYKVPVAAAAAILVAAVTVAISTSSLYSRAEHERRRADAKAVEARQGAEIARAATTQAVAERNRAETAARDLADELHSRRVEQGRSLVLAGDIAQGEYLLWREFLQAPGDPRALWALREVYATQPCLAKALASTVPLASIAFAPDGKHLATADRAGAIKFWDIPACSLAATIFTQAPDVTSLAFAPGGKTLACASSDGTVRLLDVATRQCFLRLTPPSVTPASSAGEHVAQPPSAVPCVGATGSLSATAVAFSPDGRALASCAGNNVLLWDPADGQLIATLSAHTDRVATVAFSPDGRTLASGGADRNVILWDLGTDESRATLASHLDAVSGVTFSPDGRLLASASHDGTVILWQTSDGACLASLEGFGCWVHSIAFAPDGASLAAGDIRGNVKVWDLATGRCTTTIPAHVEDMDEPTRPAVVLAYTPAGDLLATGSTLGVLKLWDVSPGRPMLALPGHTGGVVTAAFVPGGTALLSRDGRGTIRAWDLSTGRCTRTISGLDAVAAPPPAADPAAAGEVRLHRADQQQFLACSPDGSTLASIDADDSAIVLRSVTTGEILGRLTAGADGRACLRRGTTRSESHLRAAPGVPASAGSFSCVTFAPAGKTLAAGSRDGRVLLWDAASLQLRNTIDAPAAVAGLRFSPDGRVLAAACGKTIALWDAGSAKPLATLEGHVDPVRCLAFAPAGGILASAGDDGVLLWDVPAASRLGLLEGQAGATYDLAFSPDGRTLACSDRNRTIRLWQVPEGRCIATLQTGERPAWSLAFSADGRMLACGGEGDSLRLFDLGHFDRNILGNYPFYLELAGRWPDLARKVSRDGLDRWAAAWAAQAELPLWARAAASRPAGQQAVDLDRIADWGQLTRHRLLTALRSLGHAPIQARLPVEGAADVPLATVIFRPAGEETRIHTLLGSGNSPDRARAAELQQQKDRQGDKETRRQGAAAKG